MATSDALKIARLECSTQLTSQVVGLLSDPLWSTILGFIAIHEARKRDLIGPVADDILYAGVIAVNTARSPALTDLAGKGITAASGVAAGLAAGLAGGIGAVTAGAVAKKAGTAISSKVGTRAVGVALLPVGIATSMAVKDLERKGYTVTARPSYGSGGGDLEY